MRRPVAVVRHASALAEWEMARAAPHPALRAHVAGYCGYREASAGPFRRTETPSAAATLIVSFGDELSVRSGGGPARRVTSFLAPLHDLPATTEHGGRQHGVEVRLSPLATRRLVGIPLEELPGGIVDLELVLGARAAEVTERLATAGGWQERFAYLDGVLARRLAAAPPIHPGVHQAWARLTATHGTVPIATLARELGWSPRHLGARVRADLGLPPKVIARILRFDRARRLLGRAGGERVGVVALACGYYDQAHLNRDFRALAGASPTELLDRSLPDGGGTAAAAA